jgi:hypothetical protein
MGYDLFYGNPHNEALALASFQSGQDQAAFARNMENNRILLSRRQLDLQAAQMVMESNDRALARSIQLRQIQAEESARQDQLDLARRQFGLQERRQDFAETAQTRQNEQTTANLGELRRAAAIAAENQLREAGATLWDGQTTPTSDQILYTAPDGRRWLAPTSQSRELAAQERERQSRYDWYQQHPDLQHPEARSAATAAEDRNRLPTYSAALTNQIKTAQAMISHYTKQLTAARQQLPEDPTELAARIAELAKNAHELRNPNYLNPLDWKLFPWTWNDNKQAAELELQLAELRKSQAAPAEIQQALDTWMAAEIRLMERQLQLFNRPVDLPAAARHLHREALRQNPALAKIMPAASLRRIDWERVSTADMEAFQLILDHPEDERAADAAREFLQKYQKQPR